MSYNSTPDWVKVIIETSEMKCPACGCLAFNVVEATRCLFEHDYYAPRHIPPYLTLTCGDCGEDFRAHLVANVSITRIEGVVEAMSSPH